MTNIEKAHAARKDKELNKPILYFNKEMSRKEFVETLIQLQHGKPYIYKEPKIKPMSRTAFFCATQQEQDRHERRMREAGDKTCYAIMMPEGGFHTVPKIVYDYACQLYCDELAKEE